MMGGASKQKKKGIRVKTKGGDVYEECAYPEYIDNADFQTFIKEFYLIKRVCHSYAASVYVIPETSDLKKMVDDFKKMLKEKNIPEKSAEAFQFTAITNLPFKRCIFSVFADADSAHYKLDDSAPYKHFDTLKRTNLLSEQYYFKYKSNTEILVCPEEKSEKGATTIKLIAKCLTGIYVFQGSLPKAKQIYENKVKSLNGGSSNSRIVKFNNLEKYVNLYGEQGAERFISSCVKANKSKIKDYAKLFSGDLLHSAFRICFNDAIPDGIEDANDMETRKITEELIKMYKPSEKAVDTLKFMNLFKKVYGIITAKSLDPKQSSKEYMNQINQIYNKCGKDMLYADIATNLYRSHNYESLQDIYNLVENVESVNNNSFSDSSVAPHFEFSDTSTNVFKTSKLCNYVNQALLIAPLVGINAKSYYPQLQSIDTVKNSYSMNNMYGGYFEDDNSNDSDKTDKNDSNDSDDKNDDSNDSIDINNLI
jgi:hypothetical protein